MTATKQATMFPHQIDRERFEYIASFHGYRCRSGVETADGGKRAKFFAEGIIESMGEAGRHAILITNPTPGCYYEPEYQVWGER
jgi:hypothetical protein